MLRPRHLVQLTVISLLASMLVVDSSAAPDRPEAPTTPPKAAPMASPTRQPGAGQFTPVAPASVVNGVAVAAGGTTTVTVTGANGVPAAAQVRAVAVQVTATGTTGSGFVTLYQAGTTRPADSTNNYYSGRNTISYDVVPVSATGQITVYASTAATVWVRLRGYFTSAAATTAGSTFVPLAPTAIVNNVALATNGTTTVTVAGANGVPAAAQVSAVAVDMIASAPTAAGLLKAYPATPPGDASVYYAASQNRSNYETVKLSSAGQVTFSATGATGLYVRLRGYYSLPSTTTAGSSYVPVAPATVVNNVALAAGGTTNATLAGANGVPAAAQVSAVAANVVASAPTAAGIITGYPAGATRPSDASVYYANGVTSAAHDSLKFSTAGQTTFYASGATKLLVRLRGYYGKATAPLAPTGITATAGDGNATVNWVTPKDGGAAITGYTVTANPGGIKTTVGVENSATVPGLTNGRPYTFTVQAINAVGTGPASAASRPVVPNGGEALYAHDAAGRVKAVFTEAGAGVAYVYDTVGNITATQSLPANQLKVVQSGPATAVAGDEYEIYGTGFGLDPQAVSVTIGGVVAPIKSLRRNHIVVTVPSGGTTDDVTVTVSGSSTPGGTVSVLKPPTLATVSPAVVDRGSNLTISGTNFATGTGLNTVLLNGTKLQVITATPTSLTVKAPAFGTAGRVVVRTRAGTATSTTIVTVPPSPFLAADVAASNVLTPGTASTVNITTSNQIALFTLEATAGQRAGFQIQEAISGCFELHVWAPDRSATIAEETVCGGMYVDLPRPATVGTYLVELDPRDPTTGSFTVTARQAADVMAPVTIDGPQASITTTVVPSHAVFSFTGTKGQLVFTSLTAPTKLAQDAVLWGPQGQKLGKSGVFYGSSPGSGFISAVKLPEDGTYTIDVDPYNFDVGTYTALVTSVPDPVNATTTIDGAAATLNISKPGQTGSVSFSGTQGQLVHLDIARQLSSGSDGKATLRGPDGSFLFRDRTWSYFLDYEVDRYTLPQTGEYLLLVDPYGAQTGTIAVKVNAIPADAMKTTTVDAAAVAVGNSVAGQNARMTFPASAGQRVMVTCEAIPNHDYDINFELLDPAGARVDTGYCAAIEKGILFDTRALTAGTWTVTVNPKRSLILSPMLRAVSVPADAVVPTTLGSSPVVSLAPGQNGSITFPVAAGQRIFVGCTLTDPNQQYDVNFELLRPDGTRADSGSCYTLSEGELFDTVTSATAGTWAVKVDPRLNANSGVTLRPVGVPEDVAATTTVGGTGVTFDTAVGQNATVSFTATAGQRVFISCGLADWAAKQYKVDFKVLRPDGTTERSTGCYETSRGMLLDTTALSQAGTWKVTVDPDYATTTRTTVRVYSVPVDATASATVGGPGVSVSTVVGQSSRVTFTGAANQRVKATLTASSYPSCGGSVELLNPSGGRITSTCLSLNASLTATLPSAGTYTVLINPDYTYTGSATVTVANTTLAPPPPSQAQAQAQADRSSQTPAAVDNGDFDRRRSSDGRYPRGPGFVTNDRPHGQPGFVTNDRRESAVYPRVRDASLTGKVLRTDGRPLAGVTVRVADRSTRTRPDGRFTLTRLPQGSWLFVMDARKQKSGYFDVLVGLRKGPNRLHYQPYLPLLDKANEISIPSPTTEPVVVRTSKVPGLEVHIPAGVRITDADGKPVTRIGITPIPVNRTPIPMPKGVQVPVYFTVQPAGGELQGGEAKIHYPNYLDQKPGTRVNFWTHEKYAEGWEVYGSGTVTADGKKVVPDYDTHIDNFDGAMINVSGWLEALGRGILEALGSAGDPVDLGTGRFTYTQTDLTLGGFIPIEAQRAYNSADGRARPYGMGTIGTYDTFLTSRRQWQEADLNLIDGSQVHFVRTSPGTGFTDAAFAASGTIGQFAGSAMAWNGRGWDLELRDGSVLVYGDEAPLQEVRDRFGHTVKIKRVAKNVYGSQIGAIVSVTSSEGYWLDYDYDDNGQVIAIHDNAGRTVSYTYENGLLKTVTDVNGGITTYGWDANKRLTTIKDAKQQVFLTNTYDANGRVIEQKLADEGRYTFAYTLSGTKVVSATVTDPSGAKRTVDFDQHGYLTRDRSAIGTAKERGYTVERDPASHLPLKSTDTDGRTIVSSYNGNQQATSTKVTQGTAEQLETATYDGPEGAMDTTTDALGNTTRFAFDAAGNVSTKTDAEGRKTTYEWNDDGLLVKETPDGAGSTTYEYIDGTTSAVTDALGRTTRYGVDSAGRVVETIAPDGGVSTTQYDAANQVRSTKDPTGAVTHYEYDDNGNLTLLKDARNGTTRWTYDENDRIKTMVDQLGRTMSYTYTALGRPETITDRRGLTTEFRYDALQRVVFTGWGRTGSPGSYQYQSTRTQTYDAKGRVESIGDSTAGTVGFTYDDHDRVLTETTPQGTTTREWDDADRLTATTVSGLPQTTYTYDKTDRLMSVTRGSHTASFTYDSTGRLKAQTLPGGIVRTSSYDAASALTGLTFTSGTQTLGDLRYHYDAAGRLDRTEGSWARADLPAPVGNAVFDAANRLTSQDGVPRTYDHEGNLTSDGLSTYTWNARGELTATTGAAGATQIRYDALGRRVGATVGGEVWSLRYDGDNLLVEDGPGAQDATYLAGLGADSAVARIDGLDGSGGASALLTDRQGSVVARTVPGTGTLAAEYTYGPYGAARSSLAGDQNPVRYTGRESGPGLPAGLQYNRARWYEPATGRFLSEDPAGFAASGTNLYSYVGGDPVDATDPTGQVPQVAIACAGGALVNTFAGALLGRKHSIGDYLRGLAKGCAEGVLMFGVGKFLSVGLRSTRFGVRALDDIAESAARACSFTGETLVLMADGSKVPISEIKVGDEVLATDPETGEQVAKKVDAVFEHDDEVVDLRVEGEVVTTTEDHLFWNETERRFEPAADLGDDSEVLSADGRRLEVSGLRTASSRTARTYNLSVEGIHTYHVGASELLVHNTCRISPLGAKDFGTKGVHIHASNGVEVALRPAGDRIVFRLIYSRDAGGFSAAVSDVEAALASRVFRAKLLDQLRTALPGLARSPDPLVRNRSIEVHRLIKILERWE